MKYQVGEMGRIVVARFEDGDEIIQGLSDIAKKEDLRAAVFYLVGGIKEGRIVVGPEKDVFPPTPVWKVLNESHESAGVGTIFWYGNEPRIHFHGVYGKHDMVKTGCLRELARAFIVMEAVIIEIKGINAVRDLDPRSQMVLLKMIDS
ncbi:MAG TPA: DNA-binding protein [Syntrophorhabdus sp.]|mgnify:FL=1|jgi:predicted DNA-binding protein with PD1-like motif|nr:DNA-binding protein [Syntrophorhabdus sp.]HOH25752.1 DNA-binding protein [Syntrophorhabdus sp.]HPB38702.1 DNA-binding protein [Syntrophorhabdus sp.]HPW36792.1 DNA-binding protein [Syntrophorhabdus sp.]HQB34019.1 DNA-binding protein [Syntrophorhabdus sp.]